MNDLISRQEAINIIKQHMNYVRGGSDEYYLAHRHIIELIKIMPSVQTDMLAYERGKGDAQANIVQCEDCKWRRNPNGTMAWIPCRSLVTPDDFYCKYAERKEHE